MSLDYVDPTTPPVDWNGPVFPEPLLYGGAAVWFVLLIAALMGLLFFRQRLFDERLARRRAPEVIYHAVRQALNQALIKTGDETISAGRRVQDVLELHLGPLLSFSGAVGGPAGKLRKALAGKGEPQRAAEHAKPDHSDKSHGENGGQTALVVSSGAENNLVITPAQILTAEAKHEHHGPGHGHGGHGQAHGEVEMSARDQRMAVRDALEALSEYWRKDVVERDLRKIQELLLVSGPIGAGSARSGRPPSAETRLLLGPLAPNRPARSARPS
jgi:hypothetical protein